MKKKSSSKKFMNLSSRNNAPSKVLIYGGGRMGEALQSILSKSSHFQMSALVTSQEMRIFEDGHTAILRRDPKILVEILDQCQIVFDFSTPLGTRELAAALRKVRLKSVIIGTTGLTSALRKTLASAAKQGVHRILTARNTSLGIVSLAKTVATIATSLAPKGFDIEICESHHRGKVDSPSGTALLLGDVIRKALPTFKIVMGSDVKRRPSTICIHSIRGGGIIGEHEVRFIGDREEITLSHRAFDRSLFASGALDLIQMLEKEVPPGQLRDIIEIV